MRRFRQLIFTCALITGLGLTGCARHRIVTPSLPVTELHLLSMPVALNLDAEPGADGFAVRIYGGNPSSAKPVPIQKGTLEILMFDGIVAGVTTNTSPIKVWPFQQEGLRQYREESSIGVGYNLVLRWEKDRPKEDRVTVVARYHNDAEPYVYSSPSHVAVVTR